MYLVRNVLACFWLRVARRSRAKEGMVQHMREAHMLHHPLNVSAAGASTRAE